MSYLVIIHHRDFKTRRVGQLVVVVVVVVDVDFADVHGVGVGVDNVDRRHLVFRGVVAVLESIS